MTCTVPWKEQHVQCINTYFCLISSTFSVDCLFKFFTPFLLVSLKQRPPGISSTEAVSGTTEGGGGGVGEVSRTNHTVLWSRVYSVLPKVNSPRLFSFIFFLILAGSMTQNKNTVSLLHCIWFFRINERKNIRLLPPFYSRNVLPTHANKVHSMCKKVWLILLRKC